MGIKYINGNIFTTTMPAIGHGVNLQGDMGSGIAKTVRELYPRVNEVYVDACANDVLQTGDVLPVQANDDETGVWILNMVSQIYGGPNAKYIYLAQSLYNAFAWIEAKELSGLALPRIGAGVGGLNWDSVLDIIKQVSDEYPSVELEIWTYEQ